jgi:hypothetical protein
MALRTGAAGAGSLTAAALLAGCKTGKLSGGQTTSQGSPSSGQPAKPPKKGGILTYAGGSG